MAQACRGIAHLRITPKENDLVQRALSECAMLDGTFNEHMWMDWSLRIFGPRVFAETIQARLVRIEVVPPALVAMGRISTTYNEREKADIDLFWGPG